MFAANLPVVTVNIPEPGWSLDSPLSATAVTTPVGCRFAAGHTVFTWKWIWKAAGLGRHTTQLNKKKRVVIATRCSVGGSPKLLQLAPSGSGRKHGRKRTKDILKYAPFDIDRNVGRNAVRYVLCWRYPGHCRFNTPPLVMVKEPMLTAALHLSNKVTVYLSDHRRRRRMVRSQEMHRSNDTEECMNTDLSLQEQRLWQYGVYFRCCILIWYPF